MSTPNFTRAALRTMLGDERCKELDDLAEWIALGGYDSRAGAPAGGAAGGAPGDSTFIAEELQYLAASFEHWGLLSEHVELNAAKKDTLQEGEEDGTT